MGAVMGTPILRVYAAALACLLLAPPVHATEVVDNGSVAAQDNVADNAIAPPQSEEALVFTGRDEKPLTPSKNGFADSVHNVVSGARAFSSLLGPETWLILIGGFGLVGFVVRRSERVLRFEPRRDEDTTRRTDRPEHHSAESGPDASTPPHSGNDPAPSAPQAPVE